jgi:ABC-2 type transport system permease protein
MSRSPVIARRELGSYFVSPIAYVAMALFLIVCAIAFWDDFQPGQPVEMRHLFDSMVWVLVAIVPVLCMGLLAQEWASGTIETLMTAPVAETDVVVGKFLGSLAFFGVLLAPTLLFVLLLRIYGRPDFGPIFSGYLGIFLVGSLFIAVALFCSSLTRSQVVAAALAAAILFAVTIVPYYVAGRASLSGFWRNVADQAVFRRYMDFSKGVIDTGNIIFFLATTAVFLFLTVKVLESRRWK